MALAADAADLVVVGAPARRSLLHPMLGSTSRLLRKARAPVLVVRTPPAFPYRKVLVAVDLSTSCDEAFARARTVAPGARFEVVHAYRAPFEGRLQYADVSEAAIETHRIDAFRSAVFGMADVLRSQTALPGLTAHVVHGHAAFALLDEERELDADLVVVCRPARTRVEEWLLPSVTSRLIEDGKSDILVVPA
jgi:nucleotide-binding universal stress UspA family protein